MGSANVHEIETKSKDHDVNIAAWACGAFGVGTKKVGGFERRIGTNDRRSSREDIRLREDLRGGSPAQGGVATGLC